jgi:hypothetical protein
MLQEIISEISTLRKTQKIFIRLSTRSGKDAEIPWDSDDVVLILKQFFTSGRVQEDIQEAMTRKKNLCLIIMPFIVFGAEYRSFIVDRKYIATRRDDGNTVFDVAHKTPSPEKHDSEHAAMLSSSSEARHEKYLIDKNREAIFAQVAKMLLELYEKKDFVFDMGINLSTGELQLIEINQNDETTDQYMD